MRLHLVRHGRSAWNAAGLLQGATASVPLTAAGRRQARAAARRLAALAVTAVWSSDQVRALRTADPIARRHGLAVRASALLREQGHGCWEGKPSGPLAPLLVDADPDWAPPGGESARAVHARAVRFLAALEPGAGDVVVVSHGETIRALVAAAAGLPAERMGRQLPAPGAVVTLTPTGQGWGARMLGASSSLLRSR